MRRPRARNRLVAMVILPDRGDKDIEMTRINCHDDVVLLGLLRSVVLSVDRAGVLERDLDVSVGLSVVVFFLAIKRGPEPGAAAVTGPNQQDDQACKVDGNCIDLVI